MHEPVLQFTVLVLAALMTQLTLERLHLPGLLGLLVAGMLLGPGGAAVLPREPVVAMLGQIGLIYVMFIAGLEIDLDVVQRRRREVLVYGLLAFGCCAAPATGAALLIGFTAPAAVLLGAVISSHTLLAYPILMRLDLLRRRPVVTAIGGTLLTDTLALVVLAIVLGVYQASGEAGALERAGQVLLPLALLALLTAAALLGLPRLGRFIIRREGTSRAEKALFVLAALLVLSVAAELIGTDQILGAFLAGVSLNRLLAAREALREHLEFVGRMLFIPFFFIWTGTLLELEVLTREPRIWGYAGALLALVVLGKGAAAWICGAYYGYSRWDRLLVTGLTLPQAAATLAVTVTAREVGIFGEVMVDAVIILIFVTCLAGPLLTDLAGRRVKATPAEHAPDEAMHPQLGDPEHEDGAPPARL